MATATQFDSYFFGNGLVEDARKGVAAAVARTRAAGLPVEGYASSPVGQEPDAIAVVHSVEISSKAADKEPKKKRA